MRRPTIRLQNPDRSFSRFVSVSEATALLSSGAAVRVTQRGEGWTLRMQPEVKPSNSHSSPTVIGYEDILASVGLPSRPNQTSEVPAALTFRARIKIKAFHPKRHGGSTLQHPTAPGDFCYV